MGPEGVGTTVAVALAAGVVAQALARVVRVPSLVLMLAAGVLLGPDVAGVVRPALLAEGLRVFVGVAVAIVLFEGGLALDLARLRRAGRTVQGLVLGGALVTAIAATMLARWVLGWSMQLALPFGALVIVTGPTVIGPLLTRLRVQRRVATILEGEGVLGDALGAVAAAVALEVAITASREAVAAALPTLAGRLVLGAALGALGGAVIALIRRASRSISERLANGLTLGLVVLVYELANQVISESGVVAVVAAGMTVGRWGGRSTRPLVEFKEQLVPIFIGAIFVLLAADVRLDEVVALGWPGAALCAALILVVRPLAVVIGTFGSDLGTREKALLAAIAPRGIVAASVASLFAYELAGHGIEGGASLRAMVFEVIASTVTVAALAGPVIASALGLRKREKDGWIVYPSTPASRALAQALERAGTHAVVIDGDPHAVRAAEESGLRAILGNAFEPATLERAELDARVGAIALSGEPARDVLFVERARREQPELHYLACIAREDVGVTAAMLVEQGGELALARSADVIAWSKRLDRGDAREVRLRATRSGRLALGDKAGAPLLPLITIRRGRASPVRVRARLAIGDEIVALIDATREDEARALMKATGLEPAPPRDDLEPDASGGALAPAE